MSEKHKNLHDDQLKKLQRLFKKTLGFEGVSEINIPLPPKNQGDVDLLCVDSETLFYIEMKAGLSTNRGDFERFLLKRHQDLAALSKAKHKMLSGTFRQKKFLFFLPNSKYKVEEEIKESIKNLPEKNDIFVFRNLRHYENLSKEVHSSYAKREFFADMGISPSNEENIEVPAIYSPLSSNADMYQFTCSAKDLAKFASVPRRTQDKKDIGAYQRLVKGSRLNEISKYHIDKGKDFVNNIILKLDDDKINFKSFENTLNKAFPEKESSKDKAFGYVSTKKENKVKDVSLGMLQIKMDYNSAFIIDGQHRLLSYLLSKQDGLVRVSGLAGIVKKQEAKYFLDINSKASKVDKDLIWDLNGIISPESSQGYISNIFKKLNSFSKNNYVFSSRLKIPSMETKGQLKFSYSGMCRTLDEEWRFKNAKKWNNNNNREVLNPLYSRDHNAENAAKKIAEFFDSVFSQMEEVDLKKFFNDAVMAVYLNIFKEYLLFEGPKTDVLTSLKNMVYNLSKEEIKSRRDFSNAKQKSLHFNKIVLKIQEKLPSFGPKIEREERMDEKVGKLEGEVRKWAFKKVSEKYTVDRHFMEQQFGEKKVQGWEKKNRTKYSGKRTIYDFVGWNELFTKIITKNMGENFWGEVFQTHFEKKFYDRDDLIKETTNIYDFRNPKDHGSDIQEEDFNKTFYERAKTAMKIIKEIIED